jgi:hypothetical protein
MFVFEDLFFINEKIGLNTVFSVFVYMSDDKNRDDFSDRANGQQPSSTLAKLVFRGTLAATVALGIGLTCEPSRKVQRNMLGRDLFNKKAYSRTQRIGGFDGFWEEVTAQYDNRDLRAVARFVKHGKNLRKVDYFHTDDNYIIAVSTNDIRSELSLDCLNRSKYPQWRAEVFKSPVQAVPLRSNLSTLLKGKECTIKTLYLDQDNFDLWQKSRIMPRKFIKEEYRSIIGQLSNYYQSTNGVVLESLEDKYYGEDK